MRTFTLVTQEIPAHVVVWTEPLFRRGRIVLLTLAWVAVGILLPTMEALNVFMKATMAMGVLVAWSWFCMSIPWEELDPLVRYLRAPRSHRRMMRHFHRRWPDLMVAAGLARPDLAGSGLTVTPPLYELDVNEAGQLVARPGLLLGQTVQDWENACDILRTASDAQRVRVSTDPARNRVELVFSLVDHLAESFSLEAPDGDLVPTEHVELGTTEDGQPWMLPLRISTLTAGATGAGKGSVLWGVVTAQGPNIESGLVQLQGIDLKGGMELSLGAPLFTRLATEPAEAVVLLEEAAVQCQARARRLAGITRLHEPTVEEPLVLVVVDELASLVAYLPDRDLMRRAESALAILLSQGRAVGFYVYGFLQDPRKEVLKIRNLFTQSIGLRLNGSEEAAMILSHDAVRSGARCQDIPRTMPGVGYVLDETGQVTRVRAAYTSDDAIREAAQRWPAPVHIPITVPEAAPKTRSRRTPRLEGSDAA